ncbi:GAF domain-containing protein [Cyanobacteria bacterium FACHB-DQ100]|nr:GAF domain-containing protein [Cyanobacteria bacterium FACHB-DQ100]
MPSFQNLSQTSSWIVFNQVGSLLQQMVGSDAIVLTEANFPQIASRFVLVASPDFSALLLGAPLDSEHCCLKLSFSPTEIADFLSTLSHPPTFSFELQENNSDRQSEFALKLIELLSHPAPDAAMFHQVEQERLLSQVTTLIRHSLNLPVILETAVHRVRDFLQADRVIIYQFNFPAPSCAIDPMTSSIADGMIQKLDGITYESRSNDAIASILHVMSEYSAASLQRLQKTQHESITWTVNGRKSSTVASLLDQFSLDMQAELVTPIVVQDELWGLLIVHQCQQPRQWNDREKVLLQRIAEHLAIAIYQAKLYSELEEQKDTLEQQVIDRTQELRDTLIAAQSASRAKSEFLATMSHELRSPLTTIIGMASTLLRCYNQDVSYTLAPQKQREYLQTIQDRGEHLLTLINDILDLSEVQAGRMFLQIQRFSLADLAQQTIQLLRDKADAKQVELSLELLPQRSQSAIERSQDFLFQADPQRVQQICLNLLNNAIKFTPAQGRVTMRVRISREAAVLQVEDTGIGIPSHQRSFLFQKFQQLDASYDRKYEGTGLGLALTKQLVELHGGSIEVESTVGVGSKFTVYLPMQVLSAIEHS